VSVGVGDPPQNGDDGWIDFEWATVRLVPQVHQGEFLNVGVLLHARTAGYLDGKISLPEERVRALAPQLDRTLARKHLEAFLLICRGADRAGPVALLPPSERFHWLTAPRSAIVQTSAVHPGRCRDLAAALDRLYAEQCR
jgi:hypothetical protein